MNNDRFKFRVWDEFSKKFREDFHIQANGIVTLYNRRINPDITKDTQRFSIEQCTGQKDKNGKLIYEGDLVVLDENPPLRVMWHYCEWSLFGDGYACRCNSWEESEVVGNIHEVMA